jgi:hypothetical protein
VSSSVRAPPPIVSFASDDEHRMTRTRDLDRRQRDRSGRLRRRSPRTLTKL